MKPIAGLKFACTSLNATVVRSPVLPGMRKRTP